MSSFRFTLSYRHALFAAALLVLAGASAIVYSHVAASSSPVSATDAQAGDASATTADDHDGSAILLGLAREAMQEGRLVAPAGANAWEFYLSTLQLQPQNRTAQEALRETFARASVEIEQTINRNELEEARREIDLLREFDRDNFTLALLGGKLAAARNLLTRQHEAEAARLQRMASSARQ